MEGAGPSSTAPEEDLGRREDRGAALPRRAGLDGCPSGVVGEGAGADLAVPVQCDPCGLHFRHKSQLRLHLRQKHGAATNTKVHYHILGGP